MKRSNTLQSTQGASQVSTRSSKRAKLSAPTSFRLIANKTEAKNVYREYSPAAIISGDIHLQTFGGVEQGAEDQHRIAKSITHRYGELRLRMVSPTGAPYLSYRVIIGVMKYTFGSSAVADPSFILEGGAGPPIFNIIRPINPATGKNVVILHDQVYTTGSPVGTGAGGNTTAQNMERVNVIKYKYTAQQVYLLPTEDSMTNYVHFVMLINSDQGQPITARYTTQNYFTDA